MNTNRQNKIKNNSLHYKNKNTVKRRFVVSLHCKYALLAPCMQGFNHLPVYVRWSWPLLLLLFIFLLHLQIKSCNPKGFKCHFRKYVNNVHHHTIQNNAFRNYSELTIYNYIGILFKVVIKTIIMFAYIFRRIILLYIIDLM